MQAKDAAAAWSYLETRAGRHGNDSDAYFHMAVLNKENRDNHLKYARMAVLTGQATHEHVNELGLALLAHNKLDQALQQFDHAIQTQPALGPAHLNRSAVLAKRGQYRQALAACDQALQFMPNDPSAWRNRGKLLDVLGRTREAIEANERAFALAPRDAPLTRKIAVQSVSQGEMVRAHAHYDAFQRILGKKVDLNV
ncbi:hypothetical protein AC1031_001962 [Aphanomyces cochlioides]|nr:hypothetical protein AC1031_001962 [Aphanomyces cochlioides]